MIKCAVFLGNPGKEYEKTRHNAGFLLSDYLYEGNNWQSKFHAFYLTDGDLRILKPLTYMNLSGTSVSECASFFKLRSDEILVVHDDLELPVGEARLQKGGGTKGHNGVKSIRDRLGKEDFMRLRIGIGKPVHGDTALYVTSPFTKDDMITLSSLFSLIRRDWPPKSAEKVWKL
jgi:peptidyl-tRNA hydrolase, PTH1 family